MVPLRCASPRGGCYTQRYGGVMREDRKCALFKGFGRWWTVLLVVVFVALSVLPCAQAAALAGAESPSPGTVMAAEVEADPEESESISSEYLYDLVVFLCDILEDICNFDIDNADPSLVSEAHRFSGYKGQFVFFGEWLTRRSGSFGRLMGLYGDNKEDLDILNHEHGHYEQYLQIGFLKFLFAIAIPSLIHQPADYYSQPWEVTADLFGGVTSHYHSPGSEKAGLAYLNAVKAAGVFTVIMDCLEYFK